MAKEVRITKIKIHLLERDPVKYGCTLHGVVDGVYVIGMGIGRSAAVAQGEAVSSFKRKCRSADVQLPLPIAAWETLPDE